MTYSFAAAHDPLTQIHNNQCASGDISRGERFHFHLAPPFGFELCRHSTFRESRLRHDRSVSHLAVIQKSGDSIRPSVRFVVPIFHSLSVALFISLLLRRLQVSRAPRLLIRTTPSGPLFRQCIGGPCPPSSREKLATLTIAVGAPSLLRNQAFCQKSTVAAFCHRPSAALALLSYSAHRPLVFAAWLRFFLLSFAVPYPPACACIRLFCGSLLRLALPIPSTGFVPSTEAAMNQTFQSNV